MKTSTRIMLAAMILWVPFVIFSENEFDFMENDEVLPYTIVYLVSVFLLKLVLGSFVDEKKAKPESD